MTLQIGRPTPLNNSRSNSIAPVPLQQNQFPLGAAPGGQYISQQNAIPSQMPLPGMNNLPQQQRPVQNLQQQISQPQPQVFNKFIQVYPIIILLIKWNKKQVFNFWLI